MLSAAPPAGEMLGAFEDDRLDTFPGECGEEGLHLGTLRRPHRVVGPLRGRVRGEGEVVEGIDVPGGKNGQGPPTRVAQRRAAGVRRWLAAARPGEEFKEDACPRREPGG